MFYLQLLSYFILIYIVSIFIFKKEKKGMLYLKKLYLMIFGTYGILNIISYFTKKTVVNLEVISNLFDLTVLKEAFNSFFIYTIGILFILIVYIIFVVFYEQKISEKVLKKLKLLKIKGVLVTALIISLIPTNNIFISLKNNIALITSGNKTLSNSLEALGVSPQEYILKNEIKATSGKNVVIIYLESFEKNWLDKSLFNQEDLAPNLNTIIKDKKWTSFLNYRSLEGATWTFGAQYSTLIGIPAFFGFDGNNIFQTVEEYKGISIGNILKKAGYNQVYMNGADIQFSGKKNLFKLFGYNEIYGRDELFEKYNKHDWGARDKDLFKEAKEMYLELSKNQKPFNLTLLTVDTHYPKGYPDERMNKKVFRGDLTDLEYSVKSVDYLLNDFLKFLESQENYKDTVVYIMPDHLLMGSERLVPEVSKLSKNERKLFLLTNSKNLDSYDKEKEITLYDIPRIILDGMEVKTNFKFINELNKNLDIRSKDMVGKISDLNISLIKDNKKQRFINEVIIPKIIELKMNLRDKIIKSKIFVLKRNYEFKKDFEKFQGKKLEKYEFKDNRIYQIDSSYSKDKIKDIITQNKGKYIQIELINTLNGVPVLGKNWREFGQERALSLIEFKKLKREDESSHLDLEAFIDLLKEYQDIKIVLRTGENIRNLIYIKENYPEYYERFIPEITTKYKFFDVVKLGYKNIIFTLCEDENETSSEEILDYAKITNITAITFNKAQEESKYKELAERLKVIKIKSFVYDEKRN